VGLRPECCAERRRVPPLGARGRPKKLTEALRWDLAYGSIEGQVDVWEAEEAEGKATPLRERELVRSENAWLYAAWNLLNRARPISPSGHPRSIPYSEIEAFARVNRLGAADTFELAQVVADMETTFFEWIEKRSEDEEQDQKRRDAAGATDGDRPATQDRHRRKRR
jgi:hypothetical protein